jgi:hypothetical protein
MLFKMTKKNKPEPANLTSEQKTLIKKQIFAQFPNLKMFADDIDFLIEQYDKDKKYVKKLTVSKTPLTTTDENAIEKIKVVKADTDEWRDIIAKMEKAKSEFVKVGDDVAIDNENQKSIV